MQKPIDDLLQKRMDRKDFLKHVGMGVAVFTGFGGLLKLLGQRDSSASRSSGANMGYGGSVYGGQQNLQ